MSPTAIPALVPLKPSQEFIYIRTYSRWIEDQKRRETFPETVDRYMTFMQEELGEVITPYFYKLGKQAILDTEVVPSMRAMWAAGPAAKFDSTTLYNCSYLVMDALQSFSELLYILMCGTGVGFSVERQYTDQLPRFAKRTNGNTVNIVVEDDRKGWADAYLQVLEACWRGDNFRTDTSKVRPRGSRLLTMGGRACLTGDTVTYKDRKKSTSKNSITIQELFELQEKHNGGYRFDTIKLRCLDEATGSIQRNKIVRVVDNGIAEVFLIKTKAGYQIKATMNHRFMGEDMLYKHLSNFNIGEKIAVNGVEIKTAKCAGCNVAISRRAERCKSCNDKKQQSSSPLPTTARQRKACRTASKEICELCGCIESRFEIHHIDKNPLNNDHSNLLNLCSACHQRVHAVDNTFGNPYSHRYISFDEITEITGVGEERVFDLQMQAPNHNFIANGFVSHNSGPEPLLDLFAFVTNLFEAKRRKGQYKLNPIDVLDINNKAASVVVVGGVRRSSEISFSDLEDRQVAQAKIGQFWTHGLAHRGMSNNSIAYNVRPDVITYTEEFLNLMKSGTGERGIFNREGALRQMIASGRRKPDDDVGANPCVVKSTWIHTTLGPKLAADLLGVPFIAIVDGEAFQSSGFFVTGTKPVFLVRTKAGYELEVTDNHLVLTVDHLSRKVRRTNWKEVKNLVIGDRLVLNNHRDTLFSGAGSFEEGWLLGNLKGDGNTCGTTAYLDFWGETKFHMKSLAVNLVHSTVGGRSDLTGCDQPKYDKCRVQSAKLFELALAYDLTGSKTISSYVEKTSHEFHRGFLRGWFDADGSVQGTQQKGVSVRLSSIDLPGLKAAQRMLLRLGIVSTIYEERRVEGLRDMPDGKGGQEEYFCQTLHELVVANDNLQVFDQIIGFSEPVKSNTLTSLLGKYKRTPNKEAFCDEVIEVIPRGEQEVVDCNVSTVNAFDANGLYIHNCAEILLRPMQFCNLSEVVVRPDDKLEDLKQKVKIAAMFGAWQSSFTTFPYLRPEWKQNCEEERLLGVSLTGIMDHPVLNNVNDKMKKWLGDMKSEAIKETERWCKRLDINMSAAITCVKPSGTVSQLVNSSSGIHARHSSYYIRRYRISATDPLFRMLRDAGVPYHPEVDQEESTASTMVLDFPFSSPTGAKTRHDVKAIEQLEHWKVFKYFWCEHNPSVTIYVGEDEWLKTLSWCYENFDDLCGVSFLPKSEHVYQLAPYEDITKQQYEKLEAEFPDIDYSQLGKYEQEDHTEGAKTYSCVGDKCDI